MGKTSNQPRTQWTVSLLAAASLSTVTPSALAQEINEAPIVRKTVRQVQVISTGGAKVDENRIRANMATRVGAPFEEDFVERDIKNLYATGLVESVDISSQDVANGVNVIVRVTGRGSIGNIEIQGNSAFTTEKLVKDLEIKAGDPVDETKLFAGANKIREAYAKKGYADVSVDYRTVPSDAQGFVGVVYNIEEGGRNIINEIRFEGVDALKDRELRSKLKLKEKRVWNLWGKAGKLANDDLQDDIRTVERAIQDQGYVYAKVKQVRREPVSDDRVDIVFVVDQGRHYRVADVKIEGNTVFTTAELTPALILEPNAEYSATDISSDEKMLGEYYGSRGYADARIDTSLLSAGADAVSIVYRITEGEKSNIRLINISGNSKTQEKVIRRELTVAPGDELNTVLLDKSRQRLQNMGYYSAVDIRTNPTGTAGYKDVDIQVTEQPTGSINVGAGFSSIDSLVGFFSLTETNFDITNWGDFRGGGQRFQVDVRYGSKRRDLSLNLVEPWFLGQRLSLGGELFYRDLYYLSDEYDQRNYGTAITLRKPLGEHAYIDLAYTLQNISINNVDSDASDLIRKEEGEYLQSKLDLSVTHDTRDSVFLTRKGHKFELGMLYSGGIFGGDVDVYGFRMEAAQFYHLPYDMIFSVEGGIRTVDSNGGDVPIFERLFLGGANNLRGFEYRDVGPMDENGEPIGGKTSFNASFELSFPIVEKVRGAVFYDVGMVSAGSYDLGGDIHSDVGIGVRLFFLPTGPIRLDFAVPVQANEENDSGGKFNFNIGYRF